MESPSLMKSNADILSTANVVTAVATGTKNLPRILARRGSTLPQTGPNEIAPRPNLIRGQRHGTRGRYRDNGEEMEDNEREELNI